MISSVFPILRIHFMGSSYIIQDHISGCVPALVVRTKTKRQIISSAASLGIACFITFLQCPDTLQQGEKQSNQ